MNTLLFFRYRYQFFNIGLGFVFFMVPLSPFLSTRALVLLFVGAILFERNWLVVARRGVDIIIYIIVLWIGLIYSTDSETGWKVVEANFALLAMPFVLSHYRRLDEHRMNSLFTCFSAGLLVASLTCIVIALIRYIETKNVTLFFFYNFTEVVNSHPTYLAYYLIFAITLGLYILIEGKAKWKPIWIVLVLVIYLATLLLTGGQTAFVSLLLVCAFFILRFILEPHTTLRTAGTIIVVVFVALVFIDSHFNTFREQSILTDSWERIDLWKSAVEANRNFLFGEGTGDYKVVLNEYFRAHDMNHYANASLNAHNQFIQTYLSNGFIGLVAIILLLLRPLYLAFKNDHAFGVLAIFPFAIYGMLEVFLGRYQGIVFFAMLHQVFIAYYTSGKSTRELKDE